MKLDLISTRINKIIDRKELTFKITEASTPSRVDVRREIAVLMRTEPNNVYIRILETKAGTRGTTGIAYVYNDVQTALAIEPKYIITRNKGKESTKTENKVDTATEKENK